MTEPTEEEIAFRIWFNQEQPMMQIQDKTGRRIFDQAMFREIRNQIEAAYKAGWVARRTEEFRRMYDGSENQ